MVKKALSVEDDNEINYIISKTLLSHDFECTKAYSGTEALLYLKDSFDVVILDLMLPGLSGEEVIKEIKKDRDLPVLVLSAKDSMDSKLALLNGGADDYMTKPFNIDELLARVNILVKRNKNTSNKEDVLYYKDIKLESKNYAAFFKDENLNLTKSEFIILELLFSNPKQVFPKERIYEHTRQGDYLPSDNSINAHISNIRKKIKKYSPDEYIETVWGSVLNLQSKYKFLKLIFQ